MSVTVRPYRQGGWMVDVITRLSNGSRLSGASAIVRPITKSAAQRWGEDRERHLLQHGPPQAQEGGADPEAVRAEVPRRHARANRQKPSGIAAKETILNVHLVPFARPQAAGRDHERGCPAAEEPGWRSQAPKTVNNVLTVLSVLLKKAVEWDVIERMPCTIRLLPIPKPSASFHDFDEYERLVEAARVDRSRDAS